MARVAPEKLAFLSSLPPQIKQERDRRRDMQALNLSRQMLIAMEARHDQPHEGDQGAIKLAKESQKFMLPEGGAIIEDDEYRAIDESMELRLPYESIALEYIGHDGNNKLIFASEEDDYIRLTVILHAKIPEIGEEYWDVMEDGFLVPRHNYLIRGVGDDGKCPGIRMYDTTTDSWVEESQPFWPARVLIAFINALSCSNVSIGEAVSARPVKKKAKKRQPFHSYKILTIKTRALSVVGSGPGERGSPRVHLRRGHIRRLKDKKVWVNAAVVGDKSKGIVTKEYRVM